MHGAGTIASKARAARGKIESQYEVEANRYAHLAGQQEDLASPVSLLTDELRRTVARIRYLDERVAELGDQILWGLDADELRAAGVRPRDIATLVAHQAGKTHPAIELQQREQEHLTRLTDILIRNKIPERQREADAVRREALSDHLDSFELAMNTVLRALGHNPADREVRATVLGALKSL